MVTIVRAHGDKGQVESECHSFSQGHSALPRYEGLACIQRVEREYESIWIKLGSETEAEPVIDKTVGLNCWWTTVYSYSSKDGNPFFSGPLNTQSFSTWVWGWIGSLKRWIGWIESLKRCREVIRLGLNSISQCSNKKKILGYAHTQREGQLRTQREGGHPQAKERGFRIDQWPTLWSWSFSFQNHEKVNFVI